MVCVGGNRDRASAHLPCRKAPSARIPQDGAPSHPPKTKRTKIVHKTAMEGLIEGGKYKMTWKHDYVTKEGCSSPVRFPTEIVPL